MSVLRILYIGYAGGTSLHRANALSRLGHKVTVIDIFSLFLNRSRIFSKWNFETGGLFLQGYLCQRLTRYLETNFDKPFDLCVVNCGEFVGPQIIERLRAWSNRIVNYNNDDPFGKRDRNKWLTYLKAVPHYDLIIVIRDVNVSEAYQYGAKQVLRVFRSADEIEHYPLFLNDQDTLKWNNDVVFIGTYMPERSPFLCSLVEAGLPVSIYGGLWHNSPEWPTLQKVWKGSVILGADYSKAIQCAKVCLGFLSKGNRDLHTGRSLEIPTLGGLFCAERTLEHENLYQEWEEAVFWSDAEECIQVCQRLLADEPLRRKIAAQGRLRALKNNQMNEPVMARIIDHAMANL